jgi:hypothetical protein
MWMHRCALARDHWCYGEGSRGIALTSATASLRGGGAPLVWLSDELVFGAVEIGMRMNIFFFDFENTEAIILVFFYKMFVTRRAN